MWAQPNGGLSHAANDDARLAISRSRATGEPSAPSACTVHERQRVSLAVQSKCKSMVDPVEAMTH